MSKLLLLREKSNLTQEELSEKSGISVRTIQRIEAGQVPKGYTLKAISEALEVDEEDFFDPPTNQDLDNLKWCKIINLSSLPFMVIPPLNILIPLAIMHSKKQNSPLVRKLISIQIIWTLIAVFLFVMVLILNDWLGVKSNYTMLIPFIWILANAFIVIRNAFEISKSNNPRIVPNIGIL